MRPLGVVLDHPGVEVFLHLLHRLVPCGAASDTEVFVEQGPVEPLDEPVTLRSAHSGGPVIDSLELQEQFVGMLVRSTTELPSVVRQDRTDANSMLPRRRSAWVRRRF